MDHNNTQGETSGGIMARLDGGIAMGSSHSNDGRTTERGAWRSACSIRCGFVMCFGSGPGLLCRVCVGAML